MDKDLKQLRDKRWDRAFSEDHEERDIEKVNRKATIVIEHIIQASDVAHTSTLLSVSGGLAEISPSP